jgi:quercetin dioxygenase-like cupin family protein
MPVVLFPFRPFALRAAMAQFAQSCAIFFFEVETMKHHKLAQIPAEQVTEFFSRKFFTGEKITLAFLTINKGGVVPQHQHESEQFSYCISGALRFVIGGEEVLLQAGELVEIPSNMPHSAVVEEDFTGIDVFSPIRQDWVDGSDDYLRRK